MNDGIARRGLQRQVQGEVFSRIGMSLVPAFWSDGGMQKDEGRMMNWLPATLE
jgi:hypothetical protein